MRRLVKPLLFVGFVASFTLLFSWQFAILLVAAVGIHESGHLFAMKMYKLKTAGFFFLPFLGGAAVAKEEFPTRSSEVVISLLGPVFGFAQVMGTFSVYLFTGNPVFAAAAGISAQINLFNLLPLNPLDGGRVAKSVAFSFGRVVGTVTTILLLIVCGSLLAYYLGINPFFLGLITYFGLRDAVWEWARSKEKAIPHMGLGTKVLSLAAYIALIALFVTVLVGITEISGYGEALKTLIGR